MLWLKTFHIFFMVCWFAGIFYLPRLFVYIASSEDSNTQQTLLMMAKKLFWFMTPFAVLTIVLGLMLMGQNIEYYAKAAWLHIKLTLVLLLIIYHISCYFFLRNLRANPQRYSSKFFRIYNELPVLVLLGCLILAVIKPTF